MVLSPTSSAEKAWYVYSNSASLKLIDCCAQIELEDQFFQFSCDLSKAQLCLPSWQLPETKVFVRAGPRKELHFNPEKVRGPGRALHSMPCCLQIHRAA